MDFLSDSQAQGLAYTHDWNKDIEMLYQQYGYKNQIEKQNQELAMTLGERLQRKNLATPYNNARLQKFWDERLGKIGSFLAEHGKGFMKDPVLYSQWLTMTDELSNNHIVEEDLRVQQELGLLNQNRTSLYPEEYEQQFNEHTAYANQSIDSETPVQPYFFNKFLVPDLDKWFDETAANVGKQEITWQDPSDNIVYNISQPKPGEVIKSLNERWFSEEPGNKKHVREVEEYYKKNQDRLNKEGYNTPYQWAKARVEGRMQFGKTFAYKPDSTDGAGGIRGEYDRPAMNFIEEVFENDGRPSSGGYGAYFSPLIAVGDEASYFGIHQGNFANIKVSQTVMEKNEKGEDVLKEYEYEALDNLELAGLSNTTLFKRNAGGGKVIRDSTGKFFVEVPVTISLSPGTDTSNWKKAGFSIANEPTPLRFALSGAIMGNTPGLQVTGSVYMPMKTENENLEAYNDAYYGQSEKRDQDRVSRAYEEMRRQRILKFDEEHLMRKLMDKNVTYKTGSKRLETASNGQPIIVMEDNRNRTWVYAQDQYGEWNLGVL